MAKNQATNLGFPKSKQFSRKFAEVPGAERVRVPKGFARSA
jgi:hypothetical protein